MTAKGITAGEYLNKYIKIYKLYGKEQNVLAKEGANG
jgi:hypothetical protein